MKRYLKIKQFRNIGLDGPERLTLNNSFKIGQMGNLVIVVGANNSGKSNVLDALSAFGNKQIQDRDVTMLSFDDAYRNPQLTYVCEDTDNKFSCTLKQDNEFRFDFPDEYTIPHNFIKDIELVINSVSEFQSYMNSYGSDEKISAMCDSIIKNCANKNYKIYDLELDLVQLVREIIEQRKSNNNIQQSWHYLEYYRSRSNNMLITLMRDQQNLTSTCNKSFYEKYGIKFLPNIVRYNETKITNTDIISSVDNLRDNLFFTNLFEKINVSIDEINNTYTAYAKTKNRGVLKTLEKKVSKKLDCIAKDFNDLYFAEDDKYKFDITFETTGIYFSLYRGSRDISLDYQSTGFKWFFNLYFNVLCKTNLEAGDIIIMDEPASNLHVNGIIELRKFLKEFAMKNNITIIIATHIPFLIDLDYLDELRVVSNNDNMSYINNDFSAINPSEPDSLEPVTTALTVHNHVLLDPDQKVVFVEGITDYNYLLTFKKLLNINDDITFLPIQGLGDMTKAGNKEKQQTISKKLITIKKHSPTLLVDADRAGKSMQSVNKDSELRIVTLADINPEYKQIESLFSNEDIEKYNLRQKSSSKSAVMKTFCDEYTFSDETLARFKEVLDYFVKD